MRDLETQRVRPLDARLVDDDQASLLDAGEGAASADPDLGAHDRHHRVSLDLRLVEEGGQHLGDLIVDHLRPEAVGAGGLVARLERRPAVPASHLAGHQQSNRYVGWQWSRPRSATRPSSCSEGSTP